MTPPVDPALLRLGPPACIATAVGLPALEYRVWRAFEKARARA